MQLALLGWVEALEDKANLLGVPAEHAGEQLAGGRGERYELGALVGNGRPA